ncbi:ADP-ribosylation factor-like protein 13B isoform X2 [Anneissia japonica]|uniref:ADP-ribosylation factor-like protein 13B isoform X1 n=1 Tax=Anneissia japonica TaxID=1529436 RepID=UPI0014255A4C|nr:ADP-ribosylation factor-like protein 13B isoform X1 [Anneissia japonica]XP_033118855.1 ADP-ribosylation factor-like protein 13B isoform X2 [Anneissia japonica]
MYSLMANCFACIKKHQEPTKKVTLVLIGLDNAGKTTAIKAVKGEANTEEPPTVGFSSVEFTFEKKYEVTVYDLGGEKRIRDIWKDYYAEVHGVVFVLDASDEDRIDECRLALRETLEHKKICGKRILVLANKHDNDGALDEVDVCERLDLEDMVNDSKCPCRVETCAAIEGFGKKMDKSIFQGFQWLLSGMSDDWEKLSERVDKDFAEQREAEQKYKKERMEQIRKQKEERLKREKEERERNGEVESSEEEVIDGDPFKKVDNNYFEEKKTKKAKKKKKIGKENHEVDEEPVKKTKAKSPRLKEESDESQETQRTKSNGNIVVTKKTKKKSPRGVENKAFDAEDNVKKHNDVNKKSSAAWELDSESEPEIVVTKKKKKKTKKTVVDDNENEDDVELSARKQKGLNASRSSQLELSQDEDESIVKKKKKKKKFKKNNKTAPMPVESIDEVNAPGLPNPLGSPSWANPAGQRNIFIKASKQPSLEPLMEGNAQKLSPISNPKLEPIKSSSSHNWSLELPEIPTRRKPNTDDDDIVV